MKTIKIIIIVILSIVIIFNALTGIDIALYFYDLYEWRKLPYIIVNLINVVVSTGFMIGGLILFNNWYDKQLK